MTDPLLRIEAVIEELGSQQAGFWTPLDTSQEQVSNAKAQANRGFGQFGHFGHLRKNVLAEELIKDYPYTADSESKTEQACSRASSLPHGSVQSVQSVQNHEKAPEYQSLGFGHQWPASVQNRALGVQKPADDRRNRQSGAHVVAPQATPTEWISGVARLTTMAPPRRYPAHAWQQLVIDAERFLDDWAQQAAALGWPAWELFGCHRRAPWGRIQGMALVLLLHGDPLAALTANEAVIRRASGAHQTWRRKPADPLPAAERCLVWELA
jgi:hypothetical protein